MKIQFTVESNLLRRAVNVLGALVGDLSLMSKINAKIEGNDIVISGDVPDEHLEKFVDITERNLGVIQHFAHSLVDTGKAFMEVIEALEKEKEPEEIEPYGSFTEPSPYEKEVA